MAASLCGKWNQASEENYGALFDAIGVPAETKETFLSNKATLEIAVDGDTWSLKSTVSGKTREDKFKLGEETDGVSILGSPVKFTMTLEGETLIEVTRMGDKEVKTTRCVEGGQLVSKMTIGDVTATIRSDKA